VVEMLVLLADEEEPALRGLLELAQPRSARPGEQPRDTGRDLDLERLRPRARRDEAAQLALDVHRDRELRHDDAVTAARRALLGHDLARAVRDVLSCHLDEPER